MRVGGLLVDRNRGLSVRQGQSELLQPTQNACARDQCLQIFGILGKQRVIHAELEQSLFAHVPVLTIARETAYLQLCSVLPAPRIQQSLAGLNARAHGRGLKLERALGVVERQQWPAGNSEKPRPLEQELEIVWRFCNLRVECIDARQL